MRFCGVFSTFPCYYLAAVHFTLHTLTALALPQFDNNSAEFNVKENCPLVAPPTPSVDVDVFFRVVEIEGTDVARQTFTVIGVLGLRWSDNCLWSGTTIRFSHTTDDSSNNSTNSTNNSTNSTSNSSNSTNNSSNSTQHQYAMLDETSELAWHPKITLKNAVHLPTNGAGIDQMDWSFVALSTGEVEGWVYGKWQARCFLNDVKFPFESQHCLLKFESHQSTKFVRFKNTTIHDSPTKNGSKSVWHLMTEDNIVPSSALITNCLEIGGRAKVPICYDQAVFSFNIRRTLDVYIMVILIPCFGQVLMQLSLLAMPPNSPERPTVSAVLVLVFAVYEINMWQESANMALLVNDRSVILAFVSVSMVFSFIATIYVLLMFGCATCRLCAENEASAEMVIHLRNRHYRRCRTADLMAFFVFFTLVAAAYVYFFLRIFTNV